MVVGVVVVAVAAADCDDSFTVRQRLNGEEGEEAIINNILPAKHVFF